MKLLGVDWGMKRIGLAISEGIYARPFQTLTTSNLTDALDKLKNVIKNEDIDLVIIGTPEGEMGKRVIQVIKLLRGSGIFIKGSDETLSTKQAQSKLIEQGISKKRRLDDNQYSAAIILQRYLDENQ